MAMTTATLPDLFESVSAARARSPRYIVNDAMGHANSAARFLLADRRKTIQGGTTIRHDVMLAHPATFKTRDIDEMTAPTRKAVLTRWEAKWAKAYDYKTWADEEELFDPATNATDGDGAFLQFIDFEKKMNEGVMTSLWEGLNDKLFAVPNTTTMEAIGGLEPNSLSVFMNEETNRLFGSEVAAPGGAFTTVEGINPLQAGTLSATDKFKWRNQIVGYSDQGIAFPPTAGTPHERTIVEALDDAIEEAAFEGPKGQGVDEYFTDTPPGASMDRAKKFILCSRKGKNEVRFFYRRRQDAFIKQTDPWASDVQFAGYDIIREPRLETTALYRGAGATGSAALVTEGDATGIGIGPRLYVINGEHLWSAVHRRRYMYRHPIQTHPQQPWNHTAYWEIWWNNIAESRMRQVMVCPGTVTGVFGTATGQVLARAAVYAAYS